jgi:aryl-alcohol dehydrogenase-like predicted oxidoreductase
MEVNWIMEMKYTKLGSAGMKVSELCMGSMQFGWTADESLSYEILNLAYEAGINFIDTADVYSRWVEGNPGGVAEDIIGKWIKQAGVQREDLVLATKVRAQVGEGPNDQGLSRAHIMAAVEASLTRLGTDYIDLYQAHWYDAETPIEETLRAFDDLIRQGKVRYIGASNYPAWRLMEALWISDKHGLARYACLQPHYNLVHRAEFERELADVCQNYGIGVIPYSPLAGGFLTGKYRKNQTPQSARSRVADRYGSEKNWNLLQVMDRIAATYGDVSLSQLALAWHLNNPLITSRIIGPRDIEQLKDNLGALKITLSEEDFNALNEASAWKEG